MAVLDGISPSAKTNEANGIKPVSIRQAISCLKPITNATSVTVDDEVNCCPCNPFVFILGIAAVCRPALQQIGMMRLVRDAFHISGKIVFDALGRIFTMTLSQVRDLASPFISALGSFLSRDGTVANVDQI